MSIDVAQGVRPPFTERVGLELKAAMLYARVSGRQLAQRLGVSQTWISTRLAGTTPIDVNDLEKIAAAIGVSPDGIIAAAAARQRRDLAGETGDSTHR